MDLQPILQGMHADVSLPITRLQDVPESFEEIEFISLRFKHRLRPGVFVEFLNEQLNISENVISVVIPDTETLRLAKGEYDLDLLYKKTNVNRPGGYEPYRLVTPAFQIVSESDKLTGVVNTEINIQTITIAGQILIARDGTNGASAFDIWKHYYGNETSTIEEYFAWVQKPANDAAASFDLLVNDFNVFNAAAVSEEQSRQTNESFRNTNEDARIVEEQLRKIKDQARDLKEQERQLAEVERETLFDQMVDESAQATSSANTAAANANTAAGAQNTYNVTVAVPLTAGSYYNKTTARAAVPAVSRKLGLVITYATADKVWYTEKYIGSTVAGWATEENWEYVPTAANMATKTDKTELEQLRSDIAYMYPSVPTSKRILADSGTIKSRSTLNELTNKFLDLLPNTKLLFCPHLAVKLRESGISKYITKLYDVGPGMIDVSQTTALNQPYLSGNIAPNEKYALKNPNGGSAYLTHMPISFLATDKWSVTTILNYAGGGSSDNSYYAGSTNNGLGLQAGSLLAIRFRNEFGFYDYNTKKHLGKNIVITFVADGLGTLNLYLNGSLATKWESINTSFQFVELSRGYYTSFVNRGIISYHSIRNVALSNLQVQDECTYLRSVFPEIESVQIENQTWATSNCEMTCTPQGNAIVEMQAATNVEKIVNGGFDADTDWVKSAGATISDGLLSINSALAGSRAYQSKQLLANTYYKVTYTILNYVSGLVGISVGGSGNTPAKSANGTFTDYFKTGQSTANVIQILSLSSINNNVYSIDNISVQEVGWADSTNLYNYIYAQTTGTSEQKEYAAVKASAMWCHYNNDPALGVIYGKLYNWYAVKLLQMDIDYYNAANPTTPWGWRIPSDGDVTTLQTYLGDSSTAGGKLKKDGTLYWTSPNTGADNSSGLSMLPGGLRGSTGVFTGLSNINRFYSLGSKSIALDNATSNLYIYASDIISGRSLRLIKA